MLGDGVNLAARIKKLNGRYGTHLLLSEDAAAEPGMLEHFVMRPVDCVVVKVRFRSCALASPNRNTGSPIIADPFACANG